MDGLYEAICLTLLEDDHVDEEVSSGFLLQLCLSVSGSFNVGYISPTVGHLLVSVTFQSLERSILRVLSLGNTF